MYKLINQLENFIIFFKNCIIMTNIFYYYFILNLIMNHLYKFSSNRGVNKLFLNINTV